MGHTKRCEKISPRRLQISNYRRNKFSPTETSTSQNLLSTHRSRRPHHRDLPPDSPAVYREQKLNLRTTPISRRIGGVRVGTGHQKDRRQISILCILSFYHHCHSVRNTIWQIQDYTTKSHGGYFRSRKQFSPSPAWRWGWIKAELYVPFLLPPRSLKTTVFFLQFQTPSPTDFFSYLCRCTHGFSSTHTNCRSSHL